MPASLARVGVGPFLCDGGGAHQLGIDRMVHFGQGMNNFLRLILCDNICRLRLSLRVLVNKLGFGGQRNVGSKSGRSQGDRTGDNDKARGAGADFCHKERPISSRMAAFATGFWKKSRFFCQGLTHDCPASSSRYSLRVSCSGAGIIVENFFTSSSSLPM